MSLMDIHTNEIYYDTSSSKLRNAALAPATLKTYNNNINKFLTFTRLSLPELLRLSPDLIDQRLSEYIDHMFAVHGSFHYATQTLFGLVFRRPPLRFHLGESRLRLRGWKKLRTQQSHPPITWELTVVFAVTMAKWGRHAEAVATLLAFDCLLRVGELTRLQYDDIVMPYDPRMGSAHTGMVIRLAKTKTGLNQSVSLINVQVQSLLQSYLNAHPFLGHQRIFSFAPSAFRTLIREVADSLGLHRIPYVPHSFRHGGATYLHQRGYKMEDIMFRGRWVALESATRYIQTARCLLIMLSIPYTLNHNGTILAPNVDHVIQHLMDTVPSTGRRDRRVWFRV